VFAAGDEFRYYFDPLPSWQAEYGVEVYGYYLMAGHFHRMLGCRRRLRAINCMRGASNKSASVARQSGDPSNRRLEENIMSKAMDDLKHEHDAILTALQILDSMIVAGKRVPREEILDFIGFLKEFADKCHHGKEEGILFPALVNAGMLQQGGPVGAMLHEHEQGRKYIQDMERAAADPPDYAGFADAAGRYSALLRQHIQKENDVLFAMAEKILPIEQLDTIYDAFEQHEEKIIGHGRHEELHKILKTLGQKYAG
jgi:hemerythrin-like domain-containing protein